jgi:hypothetical protein
VDPTTAIGSVLAAFGLSGAAGLNAWLPLFFSALLVRLGVVDLGSPVEELSSTVGVVVLGLLTTLDFVGDKVPAVDHVLHGVGAVVAPVSGALLFTGQAGLETDLPTLVTVVLGAVTAGSIHAGRATVRPASTAATGGAANPLVSFVEDVIAGAMTLFAFVLPALALVLVIVVLVAVVVVWRRLARWRRRPA